MRIEKSPESDIARDRFFDSLLKNSGSALPIDADILRRLKQNQFFSKNPNEKDKTKDTLGDRLADYIASFGGSWTFLILFFLFLFMWIGTNSFLLIHHPLDPYPFILLNLVLSCLASIQAPVILMSQKRQEAKDRRQAQHDYEINLKAELEIRYLHQKLDDLVQNQWEKLVQIQQVQLDLLEQLNGKKSGHRC